LLSEQDIVIYLNDQPTVGLAPDLEVSDESP